jgi:hypothetical protein
VVIDMGFDVAVQHYVSAVYQRMQILLRQGRRAEAEPLVALYRDSSARLTPAAQAPGALDLGRWSAITVPTATLAAADPDTAGQVRLQSTLGPVDVDPAGEVAAGGEPGGGVALAGAIAVADFNADGRQDWVLGGPRGAIWLSTPGGYDRVTFATPAGPVAAGDYDRDGRPDLYVAAAAGDRLYRNVVAEGGAVFEPVEAAGLPSGGTPSHVLWVDFDHDGDLDLLITQGGAGGAAAAGGAGGAAAAGGAGGAEGAADAPRLLRNQGAGTFLDVTASSGLDRARADSGALWSDFDADFDVDLLTWGASGTALFSNRRNGAFEEIGAAVGAGVDGAVAAALAEDLDNDGRIDLVLATAGGIVLRRNLPEGTFQPVAAPELGEIAAAQIAAGDFNNDGYLDLVASVDGTLRFWANAGDFAFVPFEPLAVAPPPPGQSVAGLLVDAPAARGAPAASAGTQGAADVPAAHLTAADVDADGSVDLLVARAGVLELLTQPAPVASWLAVELTGIKNNVQGIAARVEVKTGGSYQLRPLRGAPLHFGVGGADTVEVVRIRWPNGIIQNLLDTPARQRVAVTELERLEGSCPFLYTWDGERFRFINEVLGSSPLGMLLAEGVYHVPDGDEYVLVAGEQLAPRDGFYELRITEELRETAYIDAVRVLAIDHPESLAILPDEGFGGRPRPDFRLHAYEELLPVEARDQNGRDWTAELAAVDGAWAVPFEPGPYDGLATDHALTLELPEAANAVVQLHLTGWVYWSMGSTNLAVDQDPSVAFTPVTLQVPDGNGGWRTAIEDIGLPIAKNSTLVVDVTDVLVRGDPRVRLQTTMRLYWDAAAYTVGGEFAGGLVPAGDWQQEHRVPRAGELTVRVADRAAEGVDAGDAAPGASGETARERERAAGNVPIRVHVLAPADAELRPRGFSTVHRTPEGYETFDYQTVLPDAPWEQHRGFFTRFGAVGELLDAADDRYVVLATGDEIAVRFAALPDEPPPGWRRDYLVYLNGWLKDTDVNSMFGERVAPLPFQGMSSYPYPATEGYPDDEEHRAFLQQYLTRPPRPINPPLVGGR